MDEDEDVVEEMIGERVRCFYYRCLAFVSEIGLDWIRLDVQVLWTEELVYIYIYMYSHFIIISNMLLSW